MAAQSNNQFAIKFSKEIEKKYSSFVYSPLSIFLAMGMTSLGSSQGAFQEMKNVVFSSLSPSTMHAEIAKLSKQLASKEFSIANRIFLNESFQAPPQFLSSCKLYYGTDIGTFNATDKQGSADKINKWVESQTNSMIKDLVLPSMINPPLIMVLVNAVYFKANWETPFSSSETTHEKFKGTKISTVSMMNMYSGSFLYLATGKYAIVKLPYAGKKFSIAFVRPNEKIESTPVDDSMITNVLKNCYWTEASKLSIPKMTLETEFEATNMFKSLGVQSLFQTGGMSQITDDAYVSAILHKARVEIDEQGTVAAAATAVFCEDECEVDTFEFVLDKPFHYFLIHEASSTIMFSGQVTQL